MLRKRWMSMLLLLVMLIPASWTQAAGPLTALTAIPAKQQGDAVLIQGTTNLQHVILQVFRPNGTMLMMDQLTKDVLLS
ncbi:hypothetical protein, partial [Paenibacillus whitsoniae]